MPSSVLPVLAEKNTQYNKPSCPQNDEMTQSRFNHSTLTTLRLSFNILQSDLKAHEATGSQIQNMTHGGIAKNVCDQFLYSMFFFLS